MAYACLSVFETSPKWSPLTGDIAAFVCMHSLMEYAVVLICIACGHLLQPTKNSEAKHVGHDQFVQEERGLGGQC
jgi:hypothetical protein